MTAVDKIEHDLRQVLAKFAWAPTDDQCSALANVLCAELVKCKRDPRVTAHVQDQMRALASHIVRLSMAGDSLAESILAEGSTRH
jgi:hypothetical protein